MGSQSRMGSGPKTLLEKTRQNANDHLCSFIHRFDLILLIIILLERGRVLHNQYFGSQRNNDFRESYVVEENQAQIHTC